MIDFIPIEYYTDIYFAFIYFIIIITLFHTHAYSGYTKSTYVYNKVLGVFLYWFHVIYMGLRPTSWWFGDMGNYAKKFDQYVLYGNLTVDKGDVLFYGLMNFLSNFESKTLFFFIVSFLYISLVYSVSKRLFPKYNVFVFLGIISYFEFWSYGTNGIRNGLATSIVLLAFTYMNKKWILYILFLIAVNIHSSTLIPISAYFLVTTFNFPKIFYFLVWGLSIFVSFFAGDAVEHIITGLGVMSEDTIDVYFQNKDLYGQYFHVTGFRWDFLLYSSVPVLIGYYFIVKKKFCDIFYQRLVNIYLISNTIWIMVIKASFSNRFAYLSWFMMGLIIIYPFITRFIESHKNFSNIGNVLFLYGSFSYFYHLVRY